MSQTQLSQEGYGHGGAKSTEVPNMSTGPIPMIPNERDLREVEFGRNKPTGGIGCEHSNREWRLAGPER